MAQHSSTASATIGEPSSKRRPSSSPCAAIAPDPAKASTIDQTERPASSAQWCRRQDNPQGCQASRASSLHRSAVAGSATLRDICHLLESVAKPRRRGNCPLASSRDSPTKFIVGAPLLEEERHRRRRHTDLAPTGPRPELHWTKPRVHSPRRQSPSEYQRANRGREALAVARTRETAPSRWEHLANHQPDRRNADSRPTRPSTRSQAKAASRPWRLGARTAWSEPESDDGQQSA